MSVGGSEAEGDVTFAPSFEIGCSRTATRNDSRLSNLSESIDFSMKSISLILGIVHALGIGSAGAALVTGLQLYLPFEDGLAADASSNARDGVLHGGATTASSGGIVGNYLHLSNGAGLPPQWAETAPFSIGANDFTVQLWVRSDNFANGALPDSVMFSNKNWLDGNTPGFAIAAGTALGGGAFQWNFQSASPNVRDDFDPLPSVAAIEDGEWHHLVVSHDRDREARFYLDGNLLGNVNIARHANQSIDSGLGFGIGADGNAGRDYAAYLNGDLDEVALWDRVITPDEVHQLFAQGIGRAIPEPSAAVLIVLAGMVCLVRRSPAR